MYLDNIKLITQSFCRSKRMEGKVFLGQNLIWVMLLLGELHGYKSCIQKERNALFELKTYLASSLGELDSSVLPTWTNDIKSDCCQWEGVKCNRTSSRVMGLFLGEFFLYGPDLLNLSLLHPFEEIRSLDLSYFGFNGLFDDVEGYTSLGKLRNLETLDFSSNEFNNSIFPFLNAATSLTTLFLKYNYMDGSFPAKELINLKNLELLDLTGNRFHGSITVREYPHLEMLKALNLNDNQFSSSMELQELKYLTNLEVLDLGWNNFNGPIPIEVFCEMKNLRELDLRGNYFEGQIPLCLGSLNKLRLLDLSSNQLSGNLPSTFSSLESLEYLSLLDNNFTGLFSLSPLANVTNLKVFKLSSTSNMIQVDTESTWPPTVQLNVVVLPFCSLEKIPSFLVNQEKLRLVDLSSNKLSGNIPKWLLENNPELEVLQLNNNSFTTFEMPIIVHNLTVFDFSTNDISGMFPDNIGRALPSMQHMNGSDNGFQGNFPSSMGEMKNISFLDLSYNNFSGELPRSFVTGCISLQILKLSHNKFSGPFLPRRTSFTSLSVLRIENNLFTGEIGVGLLTSMSLSILDMSNNSLTGVIPRWLSKLFFLDFLSISNNFLEGMIPPSLFDTPYLSFLDLSGNVLSGTLPSEARSIEGTRIFLQGNNFTGEIPSTLLGSVSILDLRNNKLSGSIPEFVNTRNISILLLRGNNLTGSIPKKLCDLSNIRLLDLSHNQLNGIIPSCLNNLSFGLGGDETTNHYIAAVSTVASLDLEFYKYTFVLEEFGISYQTSFTVDIQFSAKERYDSYSGASDVNNFMGGTLDYMFGLDLSDNKLSGVIPAELGDLSKLRALNLSHNVLSSSIPDSFSKLKDIESLDLSYNMLYGSISHQLTNLTSLAVFNVSYNNLSGIIPQGGQFNTFNQNSYLGNPLLCGQPTDISCGAKKNSKDADNEGEEDDDEATIDMLVFYWSTASTFVVALIGILVLMCFDCPWRRAWFRVVDTFITSTTNMFS